MTGRGTPGPAGARAAEARILRRTRWKLVAWSAGSTLVVLLAMGGVLYAATARYLAEDAERQLRDRAQLLTFGIADVETSGGGLVVAEQPLDPWATPQIVQLQPPSPGGPIGVTREFSVISDPAEAGLVFGGDLSGTIAVALPADLRATTPLEPPDAALGAQPLDAQGYAMAVGGGTVINELSVLGAPMYVLSQPVAQDAVPFVVQVGLDRTAELRTLQGLGIVLAAAGIVAVGVAAAFGWLYAGRALVPLHDSLRRQRELAADASHELRTPLAVIRGNVELLRAGVPASGSPDAGPGPLDEIDAEVGRLTDLVDQLLLLARADSDALELTMGPADLAAEAADALESMGPVAVAKGVELRLDVASAPVVGDPARLRQLAAILVDNAVRHAPPGGHVQVVVVAEDGWARLAVTDDGPGIRPEDLPHVFDRFWRAADAPAGGSGLGLAIARWIAQAHGGTIRAANLPGRGASFEVRLPLR